MVKSIITYPTPPSVEYATDVREFDEKLNSLITDLKDTIVENNLDGLAAYQIGSFYNVIVVKDPNEDKLIELVNPRLIFTQGKVTTTEKTAYFPNLSANVTRFETISVVYQDKAGVDKVLKANGSFAILLQRKIDYTFGSTFLNKLSKDEKEKFESKLEYGSNITIPESCPVVSYKDYILKFANLLLVGIILLSLYGIIDNEQELTNSIWDYDIKLSISIVVLSFIYFFYGQYEGKKYSSCTSCQIGNLIGSIAILYMRLFVVMVVAYFIF